MSQATINVVANLLGQTIPVQLALSNDGAGQWTPNLPAGKPSTAWIKTNDSAGMATLADGHGLVTGDRVDVFWTGGRRYNMQAAVSGDNITLSSGSGTNLPDSGTSVVLSKRLVVNAAFDPDDVTVLLVTSNRRTSIVFVDAAGATLLALDMAGWECCLWWANSGIARPMAGNPVAGIWASNGDPVAAADVAVSVMYDSTP
jgi:hypothetical protein